MRQGGYSEYQSGLDKVRRLKRRDARLNEPTPSCFCVVSESRIEYYTRFATRAKEWDTFKAKQGCGLFVMILFSLELYRCATLITSHEEISM